MRKILSLIMLSLILVFTGCGNKEPDNPTPVIDDAGEDEDEKDETADSDTLVKYQLILDYGFVSDETSYAEGDKVEVHYNIFATDTDYSFYTDSEDVELKQKYDEKKGYVITFIMPAHDVSLHVNSVNSMDYCYPSEFNDVPEDAWVELLKYVGSRTQLMGTMPINVCMADVTEDGYEDICATFFTGSGIVTRMIVIYDMEKHRGYTLSYRGTYDYVIEDIEDGILLVRRIDFNNEEPDVTGTVVISSGYPIFIEDVDMLKQGLSYKTISMFGYCAEELLPGETSSGDYLSSMDFYYVKEMLYKVSGIFYGTDLAEEEVSYGPDYEPETLPTSLRRMPYDEWVYLIEEVFMEEDSDNLFANLDDKFQGELAVYYSPDDDYIYLEQGAIGDIIEWNLEAISQEGSRYVLTYDVFGFEWLWTAEVTIEEADNTYGYSLVSIEITDEAEDVDWAR